MADQLLRGEALVRAAVERSCQQLGIGPPSPLPAPRRSKLAALRFANGQPIPPSVRALLTCAAERPSLMQRYTEDRALEDGFLPSLEPLGFLDLIEAEFGSRYARTFQVAAAVLTGNCFLLPGGSESRRFIYVGTADAVGEYPVFYADIDDTPVVGLESPGFDIWFATRAGYVRTPKHYGDVPDEYRASLAEQATLNFGGRTIIY